MVQYSATLDQGFAALADPTRRGILERLGRESLTISALAAPSGMTLTGMKKHIKVLEDAGLVTTRKTGRTRVCTIGPRRLDDAQQWIESYRSMLDARLDRLGELVEQPPSEGASQ